MHCEIWNHRIYFLSPVKFGGELIIFAFHHDGWRLCDFEELIYGPKPVYPENLETVLQDCIEGRRVPLPCDEQAPIKCPCGVPAREGVVPSELGYGYYCGNTVRNEEWVRFIVVMFY